ncbi:hypothetical protein LCGC14_1604900 [marine sediment metagenome]|uniref:Squalene cyclase C-terminal domain-containing protein n=1 Tax=marine sediment metagenome TaxID=412755 RepID=A0A0F9IA10_9ZZZZ
MNTSKVAGTLICIGLLVAPYAHRPSHAADPAPKPVQSAGPKGQATGGVMEARDKGLAWLAKNQSPDGSWGKTYTVAITSFACLSYLSESQEAFAGPHAKALVKGLAFLMKTQKAGQWPHQGHSWIHGQGFATLALSEAVGRTMFCKAKPDLDIKAMRETVARAVKVIVANQSASGGWWYTPGSKRQHEGSTTVCAVQALVSAANFGVKVDEDALEKGFEYLKKCQNKDGGFDYQLDNSPNTTSMKEGTAADVATLGLMRKFDYAVMMNGYKFLLKITPARISKERFPYYGHFYGCMGMRLLGQEFKSFRDKTAAYSAAVKKDVISWQDAQGAWPLRGSWWSSQSEQKAYGTAFATLLLSVDDGRLSIFNRTPPRLPKPKA